MGQIIDVNLTNIIDYLKNGTVFFVISKDTAIFAEDKRIHICGFKMIAVGVKCSISWFKVVHHLQ